MDSGWATRITCSSACSVLETLTLDASSMTYPSPDICSAGIESIQQFLCKGKQEESVDGSGNLGGCPVLSLGAVACSKIALMKDKTLGWLCLRWFLMLCPRGRLVSELCVFAGRQQNRSPSLRLASYCHIEIYNGFVKTPE